jgi:hypothetical protein
VQFALWRAKHHTMMSLVAAGRVEFILLGRINGQVLKILGFWVSTVAAWWVLIG